MGSVTIFFIVPVMMFMMIFGSAIGAIRGDNVTKVELPYDPSEGIVWEYDGVDDPLFNLVKTETDGDKQIFTFKGINMFGAYQEEIDSEMIMDVVFTNKNGEELLYYACVDHSYFALNHKIKFWSPDDYVIFDYTPEEETTVEGAEWFSTGSYKIGETESEGIKTFTYLFLPDEENRSIFEISCTYHSTTKDNSGSYTPYERMELEIRVSGNEYEIKDEHRFYYDGNRWLGYNPALREE